LFENHLQLNSFKIIIKILLLSRGYFVSINGLNRAKDGSKGLKGNLIKAKKESRNIVYQSNYLAQFLNSQFRLRPVANE